MEDEVAPLPFLFSGHDVERWLRYDPAGFVEAALAE